MPLNHLPNSGRSLPFILSRVPLIGIVIFLGLYIYSSTLYPGGSQANLNSEGFDWIHNYWCNLMNEIAMNGQPNPARPFSILGIVILCTSLMVFFIQFGNTVSTSKTWRQLIKVCGTLSMVFAILIFTEYHDIMTIISSLFGLFVVIGIIREIYKSDIQGYKISGVFCIVLLGINNFIYYSENLIEALPLLQKVTFAVVLGWIAGLNQIIVKTKEKRIQ